MHDLHAMQQMAKQVMEERQKEAEMRRLAARHSRAGMMRQFLKALARRESR